MQGISDMKTSILQAWCFKHDASIMAYNGSARISFVLCFDDKMKAVYSTHGKLVGTWVQIKGF